MQYATLNNAGGLKMPVVGLGTWRAPNEEVENSVNIALENGYRHFDTAFGYNNEEAIGNVLKKWIDDGRVKREELFITTKLPGWGNRPGDVERFLKESLARLKLSYVDLYLIHMPFAFGCDKNLEAAKTEEGTLQIDFTNDNLETWKVMEQQVREGLIKAIGLSNFNATQVKAIHAQAEIKPAVLQVEMHAYLQQVDLIEECKEMGVVLTAYAPFGSPGAVAHFKEKYNYPVENNPDILHDPVVEALAAMYGKTAGQILLRHLLQKGVTVIPKSGNPERIKQNIDVFEFELDNSDVKKMDGLDRGHSRGRIFSFLFFKGIETHPQYPFQQ